MEVGVGIHGEPGRERRKLAGADEIADELLDAVVTDLPYASGDRVALMVNGLGGTPISELYILYRRAHKQLADRGITVGRSYVNEYCTSLDMAGASITLVKLDDEIEELLAAPAEVADPRLLTPIDKAVIGGSSTSATTVSPFVDGSAITAALSRSPGRVIRSPGHAPMIRTWPFPSPAAPPAGHSTPPGGPSPCFRSNPTPIVSWRPSARASLPEIRSPDCSPAGSPRRPAPSCASRAGARPA